MTKKIKVFICTYNDNSALYQCLDSLISSDLLLENYSINILNNYSTLQLDKKYSDFNIRVINNEGRPDFSRGHLSRSWNQAIIHGFRDLKDPDCDIVVACQNDTMFSSQWCKSLMRHHEKFTYIQVGSGDEFQSFMPEAIREVGLYDERMCGIGGQDQEYFFRQIIFNRDKSSINDFFHGIVHNPIYLKEEKLDDEQNSVGNDDIIMKRLCGFERKSPHHLKSMEYHSISAALLKGKWKVTHPKFIERTDVEPMGNRLGLWFSFRPFNDYNTGDYDDSLWESVTCENPQPILYPYFEVDLLNKDRIGYEACESYRPIDIDDIEDKGYKRRFSRTMVPENVVAAIDQKYGHHVISFEPIINISDPEKTSVKSTAFCYEGFKSFQIKNEQKEFYESKIKNPAPHGDERDMWKRKDRERCLIIAMNPEASYKILSDSYSHIDIWYPRNSNFDEWKNKIASIAKSKKIASNAYLYNGINIPVKPLTQLYDVVYISPEMLQSLHGRNLRKLMLSNIHTVMNHFSLLMGAIGYGMHKKKASEPYASSMMHNIESVAFLNDMSLLNLDLLDVNFIEFNACIRESFSKEDFDCWIYYTSVKASHALTEKECLSLLEDNK